MPCPPLLPPSWQPGLETLQPAWLQLAELQPPPCPPAAHSHSVLHANQLAHRPALPVQHSRQVQQIAHHRRHFRVSNVCACRHAGLGLHKLVGPGKPGWQICDHHCHDCCKNINTVHIVECHDCHSCSTSKKTISNIELVCFIV